MTDVSASEVLPSLRRDAEVGVQEAWRGGWRGDEVK